MTSINLIAFCPNQNLSDINTNCAVVAPFKRIRTLTSIYLSHFFVSYNEFGVELEQQILFFPYSVTVQYVSQYSHGLYAYYHSPLYIIFIIYFIPPFFVMVSCSKSNKNEMHDTE